MPLDTSFHRSVHIDSWYQNSSNARVYSATAHGPFAESVARLTDDSFHLVSMRDMAILRMNTGKMSHPSLGGNFVREAMLFIPHDGIYLTKAAPILSSPAETKKAGHDNLSGKEYVPSADLIQSALEHSFKIPYKPLPVPTNRFGEEGLTHFAFEEVAQDYGLFLQEAAIYSMPVWVLHEWMVNGYGAPFARQAYLRCFDNWSGIIHSNMDLDRPAMVRGLRVMLEGELPVNETQFLRSQIQSALQSLQLFGCWALLKARLNPDNDQFTIPEISLALKEAGIPAIEYRVATQLFQGNSLALSYPLPEGEV